jgi:tetratricopeptide (TPR) repeat protein
MGRFLPLAAAVVLLATVAAGAQEAGLAAPKPKAKAGCESVSYDCAVAHVERQEFSAAIRLLDQLVRKEPRNLKVLNLLGIALTGVGKPDAANARFREALKIDSAFYPAMKNLAVNELDAGRPAQARHLFESVLEYAPEDEVAHVYLAEIHFSAGSLGTALKHYERSRARIFADSHVTLHYAESLLRQGRKGAAMAAFDRLPEDDAAIQFEAGLALGRGGAHAEAARFFGSARQRGYRDAYVAGFNQVLMLTEAGDNTAAIGVAEEMLAADMKRAELYSLLSRAYYGTGRIKDAYDALRTAARLEPEKEEHYVDLAMICLDLENHDLGLEIVDVGLHYRPNSSLLYLQRGVLLAMKAQLGEAEKAFEQARRLSPDRPATHAALAMVWMQTGQTDKAVEALRKESHLRKDHIVPYTFAVALVRSGVDPASPAAVEAIEALRASIRANAEFAPARSQLGRLLLKRNDLDGAIHELEKATTLDPGATAALYNLAQAYIKKGDKPRAAELLERVSRMNAAERGDDPDAELKRTVVRIVKEGSALKAGGTK